MTDLDPEILFEFLIESRENLDGMERELVVLERDPDAMESIRVIFRAIHTVKGTAGFLGLERLQRLTHVGENLLSLLRDEELRFSPALATVLLRLVDAVRGMLDHIEQHHAESDDAQAALLADLATAATGEAVAPSEAPAPAPAIAAPPVVAPVVAPIAVIAPAPAPAPIAAAPAAPAAPVAPAAAAPAGDAPHRTDSTVRVDVALLDGLVNLAGELILARNRLHQFANTWSDTAHVATWQRLQLITSQLQEQVMKTRMQPIGAGWTKLTRTVRDLAAQLGKKARIEMEGEDTELDRTLIEAIRDPLTHVLRNAVDHGLEAPDERVRRGKPAEGVIRLRAYHDSGHVNIDISDDGGGIRTDRVRAKAVERGLITADQAAQMSDADAARLVFAPGFSTAEVVTNVSGRGVGMDVVRSNIEKIGGQVDLSSEVGVGTTLRITIPLTLAILPALIVECRGQRYAIPQAALRELVRIDAAHPIELVHSAPVFRLRGKLLPLVDLAAAVGDAPLEAPRLLLVVESEGTTLGLIVDRYHDSEEIVVKPLGRQLRECTQYGGATILGDGGVALILDIRQLARRAGLHAERRATSGAAAVAPVAARDDRTTMVMLQQGVNGRFAVPLSSIDRIDEVDASRIERTGPDEVVQLQGDLLPVMRLGTALGVDAADSPILQLIVCHAANRKVGVAVDQILDIVEVLPELRWSNRRTGVTGTVLFEGRVVELLDLPQLIEATAPHLLWSAS